MANLLLFMVNVATVSRRTEGSAPRPTGALDLKVDCRGHKYVEEMIKIFYKFKN